MQPEVAVSTASRHPAPRHRRSSRALLRRGRSSGSVGVGASPFV